MKVDEGCSKVTCMVCVHCGGKWETGGEMDGPRAGLGGVRYSNQQTYRTLPQTRWQLKNCTVVQYANDGVGLGEQR